ncbi:major histocompatibility complex class I-related gene protein-like [Protopterus annectens]|uniref:major histocompatibility complex class I-related gene protein-like n=1 Tax=Protopterus annectens TaxID=7888 RepID=UPI001CFAFE08|nr:major histocompatibility complex class I-related gene protein-like [Protopterus annectens]
MPQDYLPLAMDLQMLRLLLSLLTFFSTVTNKVVKTGSHTLKYNIQLNHGAENIPGFINMWLLDEIPLMYYDSKTGTMASRQQFLTQNLDDYHWKQFAERANGFFDEHNAFSKKVLSSANITGPHIYQAALGCELQDDGTASGFVFQALDGKDFINFNKENGSWTSPTAKSLSAERGSAKSCSVFLDHVCTYDLKKFLQYGKDTIQRHVSPEVTVFGRKVPENGSVILSCLVTGFHPQAITVKWITNGTMAIQHLGSSAVLPNGDGTFQIKESIWIEKHDNSSYTCHVSHSSVPKGLSVPWDGKILNPEGKSTTKLIGLMIAAICLFAIITGIILWSRFKGERYSPSEQSTILKSLGTEGKNHD